MRIIFTIHDQGIVESVEISNYVYIICTTFNNFNPGLWKGIKSWIVLKTDNKEYLVKCFKWPGYGYLFH